MFTLPALKGPAVAALAALALAGVLGGYAIAVRATPEPVRVELETSGADAQAAMFVHVAGAVAAPGLYQLDGGARVDDAIRAAGGPAPDADLDALNLAAAVGDGDKILVPSLRPPDQQTPAGSPPDPARVNINTAGLGELQSLPGIGPALAQRIIDHRAKNGPFATPQDLSAVSGIGPKKLESIIDLVTV